MADAFSSQVTELCSSCGAFLGEGHMLHCSNWRLGQNLSWSAAVESVLRTSALPLDVDALLTEIRSRGFRAFRSDSRPARRAVQCVLGDLVGRGFAVPVAGLRYRAVI
jgi:hypothetical protein